MIRIGLVSAATYGYMDAPRTPGSFHGTAFSTAFNGYDVEKSQQYEWTFASASRPLPGAKVVKVWDPDEMWAKRLAEVCNIPEVVSTPDECADDVDAVVIVDDGSGRQCDYAITPLDKPLSRSAKRAQEIVNIAKRTGTPFMSASSLRYVPDVVALAKEISTIGPVPIATSACGNDLVYYGIHALETAYAVLGGGAVSCLNVGQEGRNIVRVRFEDGRDLVLIVGMPEYMSAGFKIDVYGKGGYRSCTPDLTDLYLYLMQAFLDMLHSGAKFVVPLDEMVEVIATLEAGKLSLAENREVLVSEVLA